MIALRHGIPLIIMPDGRTASFNQEWIIASLHTAAHKSGYKRWWPSEHIAKSIKLYLIDEFHASAIKFTQLETALKNLLISLGYDDIATRFTLPDPPIYISLLDLVHEAGTGYELAFFQLLKKQLQLITRSQTQRLEICDLEPSLRLLTYRHRMRRRDILRQEIVNYIRKYSQLRRPKSKKKNYHSLEIELS